MHYTALTTNRSTHNHILFLILFQTICNVNYFISKTPKQLLLQCSRHYSKISLRQIFFPMYVMHSVFAKKKSKTHPQINIHIYDFKISLQKFFLPQLCAVNIVLYTSGLWLTIGGIFWFDWKRPVEYLLVSKR